MSFLRRMESFLGILKRLPGMLLTRLMILFPMVNSGSAVRVRGEFVEFGGSLV